MNGIRAILGNIIFGVGICTNLDIEIEVLFLSYIQKLFSSVLVFSLPGKFIFFEGFLFCPQSTYGSAFVGPCISEIFRVYLICKKVAKR